MHVCAKSSGVALGLANAWPPGSTKFTNTHIPRGMTRRAKAPQLSGEYMGPPPIDWCIMTEPRDLRRQWKIKKSLPEIISKFKKMSFIPVTNCWFSHDVTKIQTTKLSILQRFYLHDALEQLKTNFHTNFRLKRVFGFVIEYAWISKLLWDAAFTWRPRGLSFRLKKWLISGNFPTLTVHVLEKVSL